MFVFFFCFFYLTSSCCSSRSETPLSFFFENKKLSSTRGSPRIVLQLSVGRNDVWFHSTVLYDTCKTSFNPSALNPFRETNQSPEGHQLLTMYSPVWLHLLSEHGQVVVTQHCCIQCTDALPGMRVFTMILYSYTGKQEGKLTLVSASITRKRLNSFFEAYSCSATSGRYGASSCRGCAMNTTSMSSKAPSLIESILPPPSSSAGVPSTVTCGEKF